MDTIINSLFSDNTLYALSWTLIHSLWQISIIAVLLAIYFRNRSLEKPEQRFDAAVTSIFLIFITSLCTFLYYIEGSPAEQISVMVTSLAEVTSITEPTSKEFGAWIGSHSTFLVAIWALGATVFLIRLLVGASFISYLRHFEQMSIPANLEAKVQTICKKLSIRQRIDIKASTAVSGPLTLGHLKPLILLPVAMLAHVPPRHLEAFIVHELAHIKRKDYLINILVSVVETLFYFHPAVWWISGKIEVERESCCDKIAIALMGNKLEYAKALINLQEQMTPRYRLAMHALSNKSSFTDRLHRLIGTADQRKSTFDKSMVWILLIPGLIGLSFTNHRPSDTHEKFVKRIMIDLEQEHTSLFFQTDSIPALQNYTLNSDFEGQTIELKRRQGKIVFLKLDGKEISPDQYGQYADLIARVEQSIPPPPPPPAPPAPPKAPSPIPAPDAPPAPEAPAPDIPEVPEMPEVPEAPELPESMPSPPSPPSPPTVPRAKSVPTPATPPTPPAPPKPRKENDEDIGFFLSSDIMEVHVDLDERNFKPTDENVFAFSTHDGDGTVVVEYQGDLAHDLRGEIDDEGKTITVNVSKVDGGTEKHTVWISKGDYSKELHLKNVITLKEGDKTEIRQQ